MEAFGICPWSDRQMYSSKSPPASAAPFSPADDLQPSIKLSRSRLAQNYLDNHVSQWQDDNLIQSLFANLPNRDAKPEAFKQKYSFWKDLLISMTRERLLSGSVFKFSSRDLSNSFKRGGLQPICLNGVIAEMQAEFLITDASKINFSGVKRSSLFSGVTSWIFGSLKAMVNSEYASDDSFAENDQFTTVPSLILIPLLLSEQLRILRNFLNDGSNLPVTFDEFHMIVNESRRREGFVEIIEKEDILLILKYFSSEGVLYYSPMVEDVTDNTLLAIKIKGPITKIDFDIVKLKQLQSKLNVQVNEMSDKIRDLHELVRKSIHDRKMAMYHLKRKALLEKTQGDRLNSLHVIDGILLNISSVSDEAMILEAYKTGARTLKGLLLNVTDVDEAVDQLQGLLSDHEEVTEALNQTNVPVELDEELEAELRALAEEKPKLSKSPLSLPEKDDLENIITKLTQVHVQEHKDKEQEAVKTPELA